jgi:hypothetical protein
MTGISMRSLPTDNSVTKRVRAVSDPVQLYPDEPSSVLITWTDGTQNRMEVSDKYGIPEIGDVLLLLLPGPPVRILG